MMGEKWNARCETGNFCVWRLHFTIYRLLLCLLRLSRYLSMGTLLSVPLSRRLIFFWCVSITINATATEKILYKVTSSLKINRMKTANAMLESIELNDTKRVRYNTNKNTPMQHTATSGWIARIIPNKVATPFPPRKPAHMGKMWPATAASPRPIMKFVRSQSLVM